MKFLYKIRVAAKLQKINRENGDTENLYNQIKSCIHEAAEEALGYQERQHQQNPEWWSIEVEQLVKKKKKAYETWIHTNTAEDRKIYAQCNRVLKRTITEKKNKTWEKKCEEVDRYMGGTRVAEAWKTIKNVRKDTRENLTEFNKAPVVKRTITERKNETWEKKCEEADRYMGETRVAKA